MNSRDARMLQRALSVANASTLRVRHGAVIAAGSRVLAVGVNAPRVPPTRTLKPQREASFHAEVAAVRALRTSIPYGRLTLYVARLGSNGQPLLSKPCARCQAVLETLGFGRIVWSE